MRKIIAGLMLTLLAPGLSGAAETVSIAPRDAFFDHIRKYCGKAFEGRVVEDNFSGAGTFKDQRLVMHVRQCDTAEIRIPFHVGDDRSRTWILTKTGSGVSLKHDHRHKDGTPDASTMYGGHTTDAGWANAQSFPADHYSKELFIRHAIPQSTSNTWHMYIYPEKFFGYRLTREGRELRVDFDLTREVDAPPAPWGHE